MKKKVIRGLKVLLLLWVAVLSWQFTARTTPDAVQEELARLSGNRVALESVERLWFSPGVRLHRLSVDSDTYQLRVDQVEIRFAYFPLVWGEARPSSLVMSDARLTLTGGGGAGSSLNRLPLDASWSISRLTLLGQVAGEVRELFYLESAQLEWLSTGGARVTLAGSPASNRPANLKLEGGVSSLSADAFPEGELKVEFADFPAQPLLGFFTGDRLALRTARLEGAATVQSTPQQGTATGRLAATTPAHKLLQADFQVAATPDRLQLEFARGELAGNDFEASGGVKDWLQASREIDITLQLPQAELRADTIELLHEALGREALGFAENLRGGFSATLQLRPASGRSPVTGEVELQGMTYAAKGLPALDDLRGSLRLEGTRVILPGVRARLLDTPARLRGEVQGAQVSLQLDTDDIPLANLSRQLDVGLPIDNLTGQVRVHTEIGGQALGPKVTGTAELTGGGFDYRGVEVRETAGEIEFDLTGAHAPSLQGHAGGCGFELAAATRFADWRDSASATLRLPACELGALALLAERLGAIPPGMMDTSSLAGQGTVQMELEGGTWRGQFTTEDARWSPPWLPQPLEKGSLHAVFTPNGVEVQQARAQMGASTLAATGHLPLGRTPGAPWRIEIEGHMEAEDALAFLPEDWREWFVLPGPLDGYALVTRPDASGLAVEARLESTQDAAQVAAMRATVPRAVQHRVEVRGMITGESFALKLLSARVGEAQLTASGQIPLNRSGEFDVHVTAPSGTPVSDLLSLVSVPEVVGPIEGTLAANLRLQGSWEAPAWSGGFKLEELHLPKLLTEPVALRGHVGISRPGFELDGIEVVQPLGSFKVSGLVRREGLTELEVAGAWANLDRLLSQLPEGRWPRPGAEFLARHPAQVRISLEEVRFLAAVFSDVRGELRQEDGRFQLSVPAFAFGKGEGDLFAETYPERNEFLVRLELDQVPTERFLTELLRLEPAVSGSLSLDAELTGPLGGHEEFLHGARGQVNFKIPQGRLQRGTLPERLFAVAVLLNEGVYGFGLNRLARLFKPTGLRRFRDWTGTLELEEGKARIVESTLYARAYDVTLTGESDLATGAFQVHGDGNFHPGWEFDISIQAVVNLVARMLQIARGKRNTPFEFDIAGEIRGSKRVQNFRFK